MSGYVLFESAARAVSDTPSFFTLNIDNDPNVQNPAQAWSVRVWSNVGIHINVDGQSATTDDYPVAAGRHGEELHVRAGAVFSVIKQDGEADGRVWITRVKKGTTR
ncbi:hypothetical protein [Methylosinus sp. LW4]|uniref:hypothetical protein n=1 Tax=Methylosinus sp. LW4 TaxID=136993 RepID=UPI0012F842A5|nr:hypothetical protein [Methylosinus sp. LW4]